MFNPLFSIPVAMIALTQQLPTQIHVKVFPHLYNYEPMGKDSDATQVTLKSAGECKIFAGNPKTASSTGVLKSTVPTLNMTLTVKSLVAPLWFECQNEVQVIRKGAQTNFAYSGSIYAHPVKTGPELIEVKSINEYLKGVVPTEMPHMWPTEALKAQSVAARTYATFHILHGGGGIYDVDDTVQYQAYTGNTDHRPQTDAAVDATSSIVMVYNEKIIQAYFSADAGGYTEAANDVWPVTAPYCVSKPEVYTDAPLDPQEWGPWTVTLPLQEMNNKLVAMNLIPASNPVVDLHIEDQNKDQSGRVKTVTLSLLDGTTLGLDGRGFHRALGLKSTLYTVEVDQEGQLEVHGRGFGHGVGMSQYGARVLAQLSGWDDEKILGFYYTGIQFCEPSSKDPGDTVCH